MAGVVVAMTGVPLGEAMGVEGPTLVSFDIDGTLEMGDPPGPLSAAFVRRVQEAGWLIGSCSDRTLREQSNMWDLSGIVPHFVIAKHHLLRVREAFPSRRFIHIGDTQIDAHYADQAGFEFVFVLDLGRRLAQLSNDADLPTDPNFLDELFELS